MSHMCSACVLNKYAYLPSYLCLCDFGNSC
uniref:Uncharacterized protein n=1 Tax=Anguilla anguilla TaxID=7936 RepID=A0A0E9X9U0_ANGAN